uniref:TSC22 domain family member 2 n=2 Tax=Leptobrachium leishanense TaxID=445787 RepID=A0A8C5MAT1_9ANUR
MSKMPAKKKSCFQITSVTTAQAASSITEDTESLDDPDESRTEDVSSEIFDVSRATDYGGPEEAAAERSSSEETLNNVGEAETPGTMSPNLPQEAATGARAPHVLPGPAAPPPSGAQAPAATCSSRFRVIKLDHGSGEPYRRGRWTCTDYYDRDSDGALLGRPGDSIRHSSTYEHGADRDSGLGATGGSVLTLHSDSVSDTSLASVSQLLHHDKPGQASQHFAMGGAGSQGVYPGPTGAPQHILTQHSGQNGKGPAATPNVGVVQPGIPVSQAQAFAYPPSQVQPGHMLSGQADFMQHVNVIQSQGTPKAATVTSAGASSSLPGQHLQAGGMPLMGLLSKQPSDSLNQGQSLLHGGPSSQSHQAHMQQTGGVAQPNMTSIGVVSPKSITQQVTGVGQVSGVPGGHGVLPHGIQNVPVAAPGTSVPGVQSGMPSASSSPISMPVAPSTFVQSPISSHTSVRSNSLGPAFGLPTMPGTAHGSLLQSNVSPFPPQQLTGQVDDRRKSEPLPQPPISLISEKPFVKVPISDCLTNPLSVFGLPIPVDGDDDSSSSANVVAIDNKIEQAMDLVKSHLMYAVREEVEVLKEQIKELIEKNSTLERENALLKSLSSSDQLSQLPTQAGLGSCQQQPPVTSAPLAATQNAHPTQQPNVSSA